MYNNPYLYQNLYRPGLLARLFKGAGAAGAGAKAASAGINWGSILTNTQKGLGIINQAIPLVYQVKPIISNAKTMFRIADAIKDDKKTNKSTHQESSNQTSESTISNYNNKPIFYL